MVAQIARPAPTAVQIARRWDNAIVRATDLLPSVRPLGNDRWAVASARGPVTYLVACGPDGARCSCKAGDQGLPCYHVAAVYLFSDRTPEPPAVAASGPCPDCHGTGEVRKVSATFGTTYRAACRACPADRARRMGAYAA